MEILLNKYCITKIFVLLLFNKTFNDGHPEKLMFNRELRTPIHLLRPCIENRGKKKPCDSILFGKGV